MFDILSVAFSKVTRFVQHLPKPRWLAIFFLLCALPTGLGCALLTPVGMFPDEMAHTDRADGLRYGQLLGFQPSPWVPNVVNRGVMVNTSIFNVTISAETRAAYPDKPVPPSVRRQAEAIPWVKSKLYQPTQMVEYFPTFYIPAALGLFVGEKIGLSPLHTFYLGRVASLLSYLAMGTAALALARFGAPLLFAVLTLPTAINLAGSYNQDGLIVACCALAAALLTRYWKRPSFSWFAALVLLIFVVSSKLPYGPLLLLCLAPVLAKCVWRRAAIILLACVAPGLWFFHIVHSGFINYLTPMSYHPGPLWPGPKNVVLHHIAPRENIKVLLAHPADTLLLPIVTLIKLWPGTWRSIVGMISCDNVWISPWEYPALAFALGGAALASLYDWRAGWRATDSILASLAVFAAFIGMELSLYLTATLAGYPIILGIHGRYFLPLMPFFIFILPSLGNLLARLPSAARLSRIAPGWFCVPAVAIALINAYALPAYIFGLFQMPGP